MVSVVRSEGREGSYNKSLKKLVKKCTKFVSKTRKNRTICMGYSLTLAHGPGVLIVLAIVVAPAVVRALVKRVFETGTADIVQPYLARALPEL